MEVLNCQKSRGLDKEDGKITDEGAIPGFTGQGVARNPPETSITKEFLNGRSRCEGGKGNTELEVLRS